MCWLYCERLVRGEGRPIEVELVAPKQLGVFERELLRDRLLALNGYLRRGVVL